MMKVEIQPGNKPESREGGTASEVMFGAETRSLELAEAD